MATTIGTTELALRFALSMAGAPLSGHLDSMHAIEKQLVEAFLGRIYLKAYVHQSCMQ